MTARYTIGCPCPACGSLDVRAGQKGRLYCDNCDSTWSIQIVIDQTVHVRVEDTKNDRKPHLELVA